jgi:glucosamine--fructose-6-phosphate aminotransferase (isomerizing)
MCGIIAVVRRVATRPVPEADAVGGHLERAVAALAGVGAEPDLDALDRAADALEAADRLLRGAPGLVALRDHAGLVPTVESTVGAVEAALGAMEAALDDPARVAADPGAVERANAALVRVRDVAWSLRHDRVRTAREVVALAGPHAEPAALAGYLSVQQALSALDRLEVRGRDSAGLGLLVTGHELDPAAPDVAALLDGRADDPLFTSRAVRAVDGALSFVYKAAAEIGELGDNTRVLREAIAGDELLRRALAAPDARLLVLGHTRWASVGIISEPNAHPLDSMELDGAGHPLVTAALNGDVDNFADLKATAGLRIAPEITTDAKVIPTLMARRLTGGADPVDAFRDTVVHLEGSVAVAASTASHPDRLCLALRGSGQALYVGLADDAFVVASEPYGVVEEADRYLRLDGETPSDPANPVASRGQVVVLDAAAAGELAGIDRRSYDGTGLPVADDELVAPTITTRDIDRGDHPHYLLKEITESPRSFRATLRGKLVADADGRLRVHLGDDTLPAAVRADLGAGRIRRVLVIGQGTAAVAGESLAAALTEMAAGTGLHAEALPATELSGFGLGRDLSDTVVVAISQSGTTTDTNRTVDLVRSRGGRVIAVVNRRGSDLTDKADGVLYTSDGRDVEMSVASTKAFYAQIAAGFLLAVALSEAVGAPDGGAERQRLLAALRDLPGAMTDVVGCRPAIAAAARRHAPSRRSWAVVGNGPNRVAAREVRIKLSELCYKSIAADVTEDKKHIDLSSEPLVLVCAAGLGGSTADDVAKEVAIYRAHQAAPVVIATEGESRWTAALDVLAVPDTHPRLGFVLSAMAGHLFGYEAALAIDGLAHPLRAARAAIEAAAREGDDAESVVAALVPDLTPLATRFFDGLRAGEYDGTLDASTAVRLAQLLRYATGVVPLDAYVVEMGRVGTPGVVLEDLTDALTRAIEALTRPVDAIKHQAKTVTVGISRSDESLLEVPLVRATLDAGAARDHLSYRVLRTLAELSPAVEAVVGHTRYAVSGPVLDGADGDEGATITVVDKGGIARDIPSRAERDPRLRGTKHQVALERQVFVNVGRSDGRTTVVVPELKGNHTVGLTLLHVRLADRVAPGVARSVLQGYRGRYAALRDAVTETEPTFRDDLLAEVPVLELLTSPIQPLADRWRGDGARG